jgi:hypothetical protein
MLIKIVVIDRPTETVKTRRSRIRVSQLVERSVIALLLILIFPRQVAQRVMHRVL